MSHRSEGLVPAVGRGMPRRAVALAISLGVVVTACGENGDAGGSLITAADGTRIVEVSMTEMQYEPGELSFEEGETVTFRFRNDGLVRHEAVIGTLAEQEAHHEEMAEMAEMGDMAHDDEAGGHDAEEASHDEAEGAFAVVVEPGQMIEVTHTFEHAGETIVGCHEPGHWEAGMRMDLSVT